MLAVPVREELGRPDPDLDLDAEPASLNLGENASPTAAPAAPAPAAAPAPPLAELYLGLLDGGSWAEAVDAGDAPSACRLLLTLPLVGACLPLALPLLPPADPHA